MEKLFDLIIEYKEIFLIISSIPIFTAIMKFIKYSSMDNFQLLFESKDIKKITNIFKKIEDVFYFFIMGISFSVFSIYIFNVFTWKPSYYYIIFIILTILFYLKEFILHQYFLQNYNKFFAIIMTSYCLINNFVFTTIIYQGIYFSLNLSEKTFKKEEKIIQVLTDQGFILFMFIYLLLFAYLIASKFNSVQRQRELSNPFTIKRINSSYILTNGRFVFLYTMKNIRKVFTTQEELNKPIIERYFTIEIENEVEQAYEYNMISIEIKKPWTIRLLKWIWKWIKLIWNWFKNFFTN